MYASDHRSSRRCEHERHVQHRDGIYGDEQRFQHPHRGVSRPQLHVPDRCEHDAVVLKRRILSFDAHHNLPSNDVTLPVLGVVRFQKHVHARHPPPSSARRVAVVRDRLARLEIARARNHRHFAARRRAIERARGLWDARESTRHRVRVSSHRSRAASDAARASRTEEGGGDVDGESGTVATSSASGRRAFLVAFAACAAASGMTMKRAFDHTPYNAREATTLESAVEEKWADGERLLSHLPKKEEFDAFFPALDDAIFVGHVVTDLDSIAGAIGAANLYGGVPARASEPNTETTFALENWGVALPPKVEDLLVERPDRNVCLVDFQQQSQLNKAIPMANIVGIIDHHALQSNTIVTEKPIFVDIRPWGCMSSIIAHSYAVQEKYLPKPIAGMLLSAILSDTLNLKSPTTTAWDERIVAMLVQYLEEKDVNELAARQFRAKSQSLSLMTPYALVNGDMKQFKFSSLNETYEVAYSVIETTDAPPRSREWSISYRRCEP